MYGRQQELVSQRVQVLESQHRIEQEQRVELEARESPALALMEPSPSRRIAEPPVAAAPGPLDSVASTARVESAVKARSKQGRSTHAPWMRAEAEAEEQPRSETAAAASSQSAHASHPVNGGSANAVGAVPPSADAPKTSKDGLGLSIDSVLQSQGTYHMPLHQAKSG